MSNETVTRKTVHVMTGNGFEERTSEALSSVELGQDAKGTVYIKSVKVYDAHPMSAATQALIVLRYCMDELKTQSPTAKEVPHAP